MLTIRKIDFGFQVGLGLVMCLSVPVFFFYAFGAGLFVLGCWQLLSAVFNTNSFIHHELKKEIKKYWLWTGIDLGILFLCIPLSEWFDPDDVQVVFWTGTAGAVPIAVYYMIIYKRLLEKIKLRKELSAFTKSKIY